MTPGLRIGRNRSQPICALIACLFLVNAALAEDPPSLKDKSNEELLHIVIGGKQEWRIREEAKVKTHLPEKFWEMAPKDAALALVQENCPPELRPKFQLTFAGNQNTRPPAKGEVGVRWFCFNCFVTDGARLFHYSGENSSVLVRMADRTKTVSLPRETARQLYEVIWWLCHIGASEPRSPESAKIPGAASTEATAERMIGSDPTLATFWVSPYLRRTKVTLYDDPVSDWYVNGIDKDLLATLADTALYDALKQQGFDARTLIPPRHEEKITDPDEKFVKKSKAPDPSDPTASRIWVTRMLALLRNNKHLPQSWIIERLIPSQEPMRYKDERIDSALTGFLDRALELRKRTNESAAFNAIGDASDAARALAWRDRADVFPKLVALLSFEDVSKDHEGIEEAAAVLASKHADLRPKMLERLRNRLGSEAIWRGDFRELAPNLEKIATSSPEEIESEKGRVDQSQRRAIRSHRARAVLTDWRESDALTKLKLDAILEASACYFFRLPEFMYEQYRALTPDDQKRFREFVGWLGSHRSEPGIWTTESLEELVGLKTQSGT